MSTILVLGAGRSATILIRYLLNGAAKHNFQVIVADENLASAKLKVGEQSGGIALKLNIRNRKARRDIISRADIVVSLLPVHLHFLVLKDCLEFRKHVVTASYISNEMYGLNEQMRDAAVLMVGEMGLDPGIDHMSAMKMISDLQSQGCRIESFRSFTGGLIAPESDNNPWHYKFTWNPWNVITAGQGTAQYLLDGRYKYVPYNRVFENVETIQVNGIGELEVYPNRDSLLYKTIYGLENIPSLFRGTIRYPGFCRSWNALVRLGWTDDSYPIIGSGELTYRQLLSSYLRGVFDDSAGDTGLHKRLAEFLEVEENDELISKLSWLDIFSNKKIGLKDASPARILHNLLLEKWKLEKDDRDMVVMQHEIRYRKNEQNFKSTSTLVMKGADDLDTAMARLVGLPIGIFIKLLLQGKIKARGVHIPVIPEIYEPVLEELGEMGVKFIENVEMESAS